MNRRSPLLPSALTAALTPGLTATLWAASCAPTTLLDPALISLEDWRSETLQLPPEFAPSLPTGSESVLFAPGFFDSTSETHWSYVFTMWIEDPAPDEAELDTMLEAYFDGLLQRVSSAADRDLGSDAANVEVLSVNEGEFEAKIELIDVFDSYEPVNLRVRGTSEEIEETVLRFSISPQPYGHEVWAALAVASATLQKP